MQSSKSSSSVIFGSFYTIKERNVILKCCIINEDNKKVTLQEFEKIMKNYLGKILYQHFYRK